MNQDIPPSEPRHWHVLKPVSGEYVPTRALFFHLIPLVRPITEKSAEHCFGCGSGIACSLDRGEIVEESECVFQKSSDWYAWVQRCRASDRCTWIFSANLAYSFSLLDFFRALDRGPECLISAILSDPPSVVLTRVGRRTTRYVDLRNYFRLNPLPFPSISPSSVTASWSSTSDLDMAIEHSLSRCRQIKELLCKSMNIVAEKRLCSWQSTAAGLGFSTYRHSYLGQSLAIHGHPEASSLERDSLSGGINRLWRTGWIKEKIHVVDVNSLYPYCAATYLQPVKLHRYMERATLNDLHDLLRRFWVVAEVEIPCRSVPFLPPDDLADYRARPLEKVCLADPELRKAHALGMVTGVRRLAAYHQGEPFIKFVRDLYKLKLSLSSKQDEPGVSFVKMLLNSLIGKFSQRRKGWIDDKKAVSFGRWRYWWARDLETGAVERCRDLGGIVQRFRELGNWRHAFPAITSGVCAAGRIELCNAIALAGNHQTLYADTDALHLTRLGYDNLARARLLSTSQIGRWKTVTTGLDAHYWAKKHYRVGDRYVCNRVTAAAENVAEGRWLDYAKLGFERRMEDGILNRVPVHYETVTCCGPSRTEHEPLTPYGLVG